MLDDIKNVKKAVGLRQTLKEIEAGNVKTVIIAKDAEEKILSNIESICISKNIEMIYVDSMKLLGKACGIDVGAAVVSIFN